MGVNMPRCTLVFLLAATLLDAGPADRKAAEWTLNMGGRVTLAGETRRISDIASLPAGDFEVKVLDWVGLNADPPDLERLSGLRKLEELHLAGPFWSRNADGGRDGSRDLKYLAGVSTLHTITFSYHFLDSLRFRDTGLEEIKALAGMRELVLRQSAVTGKTIAPFVNLEALDVTLCPFNDEGLRNLAGMKRMKRLWLGDTTITDAAMESLAGMKDLEDLDLHGTGVTDAGLVHLKGLTKLRKLNLMGLNITDASLALIASMAGLEELNLYRTKVSNEGLASLKGSSKLIEVDVRYSRVTRGGIDAMRTALPGTVFRHLELSSRPKAAASAAALTGDAWLKAMGGKRSDDTIDLGGSPVTDAHLPKLAAFAGIRKLTLEGTEAGDAGLRSLQSLTSLTELNLSGTGVTDAGLVPLAHLPVLGRVILRNTYVEGDGLANLKAVEDLDLLGSPVNTFAIPVIAKLAKLRKLSLASTDISDAAPLDLLTGVEELNLASTDLTDAGLASIKGLTNLRALVLRDARLTDYGLAHLTGLSGLLELDLIRTRISDKGMEAIGKLTGLKSLAADYAELHDDGLKPLLAIEGLERLSLDNTHVGDGAVEHLKKFRNLKYLNLYHTLVSKDGHAALKAALPGCTIVWDASSARPNRRRS